MIERPQFVWGVDVSTKAIAFAFAEFPAGEILPDTLVLADGEMDEGGRLGNVAQLLTRRAGNLAKEFPPMVVWVEQPSGKFHQPVLMYVTGVVQAVLSQTLCCPVWSIPSGKWKKWSVGKGNASKAEIAEWVTARSPACVTQDEMDAYAIAYAGRDIVNLGRWEKAA